MTAAFNACDTIVKSWQEKLKRYSARITFDIMWLTSFHCFQILFFRAALDSLQNWQEGTEIYTGPLLHSLPYYQHPSPGWHFCYHHQPTMKCYYHPRPTDHIKDQDGRPDPYSLATPTSFHRGHTGVTCSLDLDICVTSVIYAYRVIQRSSTALKTPFSTYVFPPPWSLAISKDFSVSVVWFSLECQTV